MNELISTIKSELTSDNRFRFDGKHFHFYSDDIGAVAKIEDQASNVKHVYGIGHRLGSVSFICDKANFRDQLIDLVIISKGF